MSLIKGFVGRKVTVLAVALLASSMLLVGCSAKGGDETPSATPETSAATVSTTSQTPYAVASTTTDDITVSGSFGSKPEVDAAWPFRINETQTRVLEPGDGATIPDYALVRLHYIGINGRTGEAFDNSYDNGQAVTFNLDEVIVGFKKGLVGQQVGSRVLIAVEAADGYVGGLSAANIEDGDTLIFICDIEDASRPGPVGDDVEQLSTLPKVTDNNGVPSVSYDKSVAAPTSLVAQTIIKGTGEVVEATDSIQANYLMVDYVTGETLYSSYADGGPRTGQLSDLVTGWVKGLSGDTSLNLTAQTVGSRVLLIVPAELAYPDGNDRPAVQPGSTLIFVVDVLYAYA